MKRQHKPSRRRKQVVRVWTRAQAQQALPLIASIVRSLREHQLETQAQQLRAERLANRWGRPDRNALIAHEEALREVRESAERLDAGLRELVSLNIYCLDPVRGLAFIPFAYNEQLAWFVFDLFAQDKLETWRYHNDPLTTRRPVADLNGNLSSDSLLV